jgi:lipopolysaccharide/colanic/teichoic acid biosynthesis glycosyltransferase
MFPLGVPISKRLFDLVLVIPGIILISPLLGLIALLVWIKHGRPIFFKQTRPGYRCQPFGVIKFRTIMDAYSSTGELLPDSERLTNVGQFLRSTSMDELPEIFNVLSGKMSLVGPRPLLMQYLDRYTPEQARRHDVLPGMAGWAQVNGRNLLSWEDKFRMDVWYVDNWSIGLDIKILGLTFWKVLKREGISQPGHATSEEFMGSPEKVEDN